MTTDEKVMIEINVAVLNRDELTAELQRHLGPAATAVEFCKQPRVSEFRAVDPSVLVAVVGAGGTALGALITGLLAIGKEQQSKRLILKTNGISMDIPIDAPLEKVEKLIQLIQKYERSTLTLLNAPWETGDN